MSGTMNANAKRTKLYEIKFNQYTNSMKDTVCDKNEDLAKKKYMKIGKYPLIVKEEHIEDMKQYGDGLKSCTFIGMLYE